MKNKIGFFPILFTCLAIALVFFGVDAFGAGNRPNITTAQRALDMLEVQNVMSKHEYIRDNTEELKTIWVRQDGSYAKTAKWTSPSGIWEGMDLIMDYYGIASNESEKKTLEEIHKLYPEIEVKPENYGIGTWGFNSPANPVIEIAGDGKTAKAIWESNGPYIFPSVVGGKLSVSGTWFWRTYAVDFVKEDGRWKFWHMNIVYDISSPLNAEYGMDYTKVKAPERDTYKGGGQPGLPSPTRPNPDPYPSWSPTRVPRAEPRVPEPYYTFSETFSY